MPRRTKADIKKAEDFASFGMLRIPLEQLKDRVENGEQLIFEESLFSDPGEDYTALYLDGECVGYWRGY